ncbi:Rz-like lysis system protein LysB [Halopseudomonas oceani]|uniref:Rz-like lysis system protein LysB n=1 Tax=Halopseudomonas oceani TaxID=1708783 RepID=UPI002AA60AEB|nr:Rz-like lysis system protein LysB [Halopseudomonas oceani]
MTTLRQSLYGLALLAALAGLLYIQHQRVEIAQGATQLATERAQTAEQQSAAHLQTITKLTAALDSERIAQQQLQTQTAGIRQQLRTSQQQIEELKRENEDLREWADTQLPAAARSLRTRPAITGAAAYRDWLSRRNAMHPVPNAAADQRSPAD